MASNNRREPWYLRLRLIPAVVISLPLFLPPLILLTATVDSLEFRRSARWPKDLGVWVFVRNQKERLAQAFTAKYHAEPNDELPVLSVFIPRRSLNELNDNLPLSGFVEKRGSIATAAGYVRVDARYRGDNAYHWYFPKRSWRFETDKATPVVYGREFDLVNPKDVSGFVQYTDSRIAARLGLLTTKTDLLLLNLNRRFQGVYLYQELVDETFLRRIREMPGDILSGDPSVRLRESFGDLFADATLWDKDSTFSGVVGDAATSPLIELLRRLHEKRYWREPRRMMDEDYMQRFCAFISLIGTCHYDSVHNVKIYVDPLSGMLRFIETDSTGLNYALASSPTRPDYNGVDISSNPIFAELLLNPVFNYEKNRYLYQSVLEPGLLEGIKTEIRSVAERMEPYFRHDKLDRIGYNEGPRRRSGSEEAEALCRWIDERATWLRARLAEASLSVAHGKAMLKLDAAGYSPCTRLRLTFDSAPPEALRVFRDVNLNGSWDEGIDVEAPYRRVADAQIELSDVLYPGRIRYSSIAEYRWYLVPAALTYAYVWTAGDAAVLTSVSAINAVTGDAAEIKASGNWTVASTDSYHPWQLPSEAADPVTVELDAGEHAIRNDWIVRRNETVVIKPGARLLMDPGTSIFCFGRISAEGTADAPIEISAAQPGRPWGVLALQGAQTAGSRFRHTRISGGSDGRFERVYYSGMVSVHYCPDAVFSNCTFESNVIGDDSFRAAKSGVDLLGCDFIDAAGDAVDFDLSSGRISGCRFVRSGNDAIDLMSSDLLLEHNRIEDAGDKGISIGEQSRPVLYNNLIDDALIGIEVKDGSRPVVLSCTIFGRAYGVHAYVKNWRYGDGGHACIRNSIIRSAGISLATDDRSDIQVSNSIVQDSNGSASWEGHVSVRNGDAASNADRAPGESRVRRDGVFDRLYGLSETAGSDVGYAGIVSRVSVPAVVFVDRFRDDFTTNLLGWRPGGDVRRSVKFGDHIVLRGFPGRASSMVRRIDRQVPAGACLGIEAAASGEPVELRVVVSGADVHRLQLTPEFHEVFLPLSAGTVGEVEIELPLSGQEIEIRQVRLIVPTAADQHAAGDEVAATFGRNRAPNP